MRTRCSSMPSAETLVKPAGSTRVTLAVSGGPPQPSTVALAPSRTFTASVERYSTTSSRFSGSPMSTSGVPARTTRSLSWMSRSTRPLTGARTVTQQPTGTSPFEASSGPISLACALSSSRLRTSRLDLARATAARRVSASIRARSCARSEIVLLRIRARARASSLSANSSSNSAWRTSASASATAALPASTCASSSRSVRTSRKGGADGSMVATAVTSFLTLSPTSSGRRSSLPPIGAETV